MNNVDCKTSLYFPLTFIFFGALLGVGGIALVVSGSPVIGVVLLLVGLVLLTTHYRLAINFDKKTYHDYVWILGLKHGEKVKFENIEYLFIKKSRVSQTMSVRVASSTIQKEVYDGYLKFSEKDKIHLLTKDNKNDLIAKLKEISSALKVKIVDYSAGEPKEI
jgi:hypothetical protein